jgi:hypothetical protein
MNTTWIGRALIAAAILSVLRWWPVPHVQVRTTGQDASGELPASKTFPVV